MEKIKVLIVEDQLMTAERLKATLEDHNFCVAEMVDTGERALEVVSRDIDLILMDIQLAGELDGIATAKKINEQYKIPVIYLSDHTDDHTVDRAKETFPANYLSKPFKKGDLLRALELAFHNASQQKAFQQTKLSDRIFIRTGSQSSTMVPYADILYLEADRAYSAVVTRSGKHTLSSSMGKVFDQFESPDFVRISRHHVVNISHITGIDGNQVVVGGKKLQMTDGYKKAVMDTLKVIK